MCERLAANQSARRVAGFILAGCAIVPVFSFLGSGAALIARAAVVAMAALAGARPGDALLVFAALSPLAGPLGALLGSPQSLAEPLALAFLGGWLLGEAVRLAPRPDSTTRLLSTPALLFAGAAAASCAVQLVVLQAHADDSSSFLRQALVFLSRDYFVNRGFFRAITTSALILEGVGFLGAVAILARRDPTLGVKLARMVAIAAAGVAALNVDRLLTVSLRTGDFWGVLSDHFLTLRISSVFPDVNAAGSYLAMTVLVASGFVFAAGRLRAGWATVVCLLLGGLWLTGSRAAVVAAPVAGALVVATSQRRARSSRRLVLAGITVLLLSSAGIAYLYPRVDTTRPVQLAWSLRADLASIALKMFGTHPVFGVGVGRFYPLSEVYSTPELRPYFLRENAHNNFLQILAELGIVGLGLFLWILIGVAGQVRNALAPGRASPILVGVAGGLTAFLLTCLLGHPLLIPEVAYAFWLVLGLAGALAAESPRAADRPRVAGTWASPPVLVGTAILILIVSVPFRGMQMRAEADRDQTTIGLSDWQTDGVGRRFRWMADHAQFYVPSAAGTMKLPLRLEDAEGGGPVSVEIYLDGRLASRIRLEGSAWHDVRFVMPRARPGQQFWRVELSVPETPAGAGGDRAMPPRIQVGELALTKAKQ